LKARGVRVGLALAIVAGLASGGFDLAAPLERKLLDAGFAALRGMPLDPRLPDIVVIGVDEPSVAALPEPIALWHRELGELLGALAGAGARLVGLDLVLPDRSYAAVAPDLDRALVDGILKMRQAGGIVLAITVDAGGQPRPVHAPFLAAAGPGGAGYALWHADPDRVVRRFDERLGENGETVPTFSGQLARALHVEPVAGGINYALGERFDVLPFIRVLDWARAGDAGSLRQAVAGKIVLVGTTLRFIDRVAVPAALASDRGQDDDDAPGVLVNAQTLRTLLAQRTVQPLPAWLAALLAGAAGCAWLAGRRPIRALVTVLALAVAGVTVGVWALAYEHWLPVGAIVGTAALAAGARLLLEAGHAWRERLRLRRRFAGYVSPQVMDEIETGRLDGMANTRRFICAVMIDLRGFTARSERESPGRIVAMLNAWCEEATAAIHAHGGTVDKFMGDGILALFGAPAPLASPCSAAFAAARDLLERMHQIGKNGDGAGAPAIEVDIGLACGEATVGHIGAATRYAYTAIGDCVNVAARLEALAQEVDYPLLLSQDVVARLAVGEREQLVSLGIQALKGHSPIEVFGWR
jgi:adenylate cyclase